MVIIFVSFLLAWYKFEGGFASMKLTTENSGEAALAKWRSQVEREASAHVVDLQRVGTARARVEARTREIARIIITIAVNLLGKAYCLK